MDADTAGNATVVFGPAGDSIPRRRIRVPRRHVERVHRERRPTRGLIPAWRTVALLGVLLAAVPARPAAADEPFTPIAGIRTLSPEELARSPEVRVRAVVTRARESSLFIQDDSAGIYVNIARSIIRGVMPRDPAPPVVPLGAEVEIAGVVYASGFSPLILPRSITVLGPKPLPEPRPFDPEALFEGALDSQLVEAEGIVQDVAEFGDHWRLALDHQSQPFLVSIVKTALESDPRELINATIRARGPTSSLSSTGGGFLLPWVFVERPDWLHVVSPRPCAPFESPKVPLGRLNRFHTTAHRGHMVRTEGTVTHLMQDFGLGREIYLQDGDHGLRVTARESGGVAVGDRIEVAGFVRRDGHVAGIAYGLVRKLRSGPPPEPVAITPERIEAVNMEAVKTSVTAVPSDYTSCLIRFPARLVDFREETYQGTLVLSTGDSTVTAVVPTSAFAALRTLPLGSDVAVTGITRLEWDIDPLAWPNRRPRQFSLIVRTADDVVLLRRPSPWTTRRLVGLLGATLAALTGAVAWAWSLRRRREQLERLVTERTRELTAAREREQQVEEQARVTLKKKLRASLAASAVAHEINQPLARILLMSRMELDAGSDGREALEAIVADAGRVVATIDKMRVLLRNVETQHEEIDLAQVVWSSLLQVKFTAAKGGVAIRQVIPATGCRIMGDAVQLQLAVTNLLRNAIEALGTGRVATREVEVTIEPSAQVVVLTVGDSGPGWTGGSLDDALVSTTKPTGAGVGLFVVRTAVENHGGTITVGRSRLGGAEFRIVLPGGADRRDHVALADAS